LRGCAGGGADCVGRARTACMVRHVCHAGPARAVRRGLRHPAHARSGQNAALSANGHCPAPPEPVASQPPQRAVSPINARARARGSRRLKRISLGMEPPGDVGSGRWLPEALWAGAPVRAPNDQPPRVRGATAARAGSSTRYRFGQRLTPSHSVQPCGTRATLGFTVVLTATARSSGSLVAPSSLGCRHRISDTNNGGVL